MRKTALLALFLIFSTSIASALTTTNDRRIDEDKRRALKTTEPHLFTAQEPSPTPPTDIETAYFTKLLSKRSVDMSDACKVLVILMGLDKDLTDTEAQIAFLKEKNVFPKKILDKVYPGMALRKGLAAYMFCRTIGIRGGVALRLFGTTERYAMKELIYEGIMWSGDADDAVTGKELVIMLIGSAEHISARSASKNRK